MKHMDTRWIICSFDVSEINRKLIKARAKVRANQVVEGLGEIFSRPSPDKTKKRIDIQFLVLKSPSHGQWVRFYLTEQQAKRINREAGEGYDFVYEGLLEPEDCV